MRNVSAKPGNLVTVTRMSEDNLALVVGWRDSAAMRAMYPRLEDRFVMLQFIQPALLGSAGALPYDTRDLEVVN